MRKGIFLNHDFKRSSLDICSQESELIISLNSKKGILDYGAYLKNPVIKKLNRNESTASHPGLYVLVNDFSQCGLFSHTV